MFFIIKLFWLVYIFRFNIMSGRRSGDISGIQEVQNGPIVRSKDFPEFTNCSKYVI